MKPWMESAQSVAQQLATNPAVGLSSAEAEARLIKYGPNELKETGGRSIAAMLFEQFSATMVVILIIAAVVSLCIGKYLESVSIFIIVIMFGLLGFFQDYRAEKAMAALKKMSRPRVRVRRDGQICELESTALVPGDVVLIENGNIVPADGRLVECVSCQVQEAALTGESESVEKHLEVVPDEAAGPGDRRNMVFMGTTVTNGRGAFIVTGSGMDTELGRIAAMLSAVKETQTPLQKKLDGAGKLLAAVGGAVAVLIAGAGLLRGESPADMFLLAISVAVAVIPEGLPAVVTITLAIGARRMLARHALIRRLPAVETLGSVTHICSDKTGTLTQNRMTVQSVLVPENPGDVPAAVADARNPEMLLLCGALCNDARLSKLPDGSGLSAIGDPTEGALVMAAGEKGLQQDDIEALFPRVAEFAFDSDRKRMTTVHEITAAARQKFAAFAAAPMAGCDHVAFIKGSPDGLLDTASSVMTRAGAASLDDRWTKTLEDANESLAQSGMRVLGAGFRPLPKDWKTSLATADQMERNIVIAGLFGLIDPPRSEVRDAIALCRTAGIRPFMITGDHPLTARAIAKELKLDSGERAISGKELQTMDEPGLTASLHDVSVFARVSPEHKIRIVTALQQEGGVVAMTGDGVNDAPALKKADIGVAMGITGTDVSKEASDMVLQDDNFATIVAAVEEGRVIYDNIRKFIKFSIAGNLGKILAVSVLPFACLFLLQQMNGDTGLTAPAVALLPLQLLWLNLLTDGLLGVGLGVEPAESGVMKRPPVSPTAGVFSGGMIGQILRMGGLIGLISLATGIWSWHSGSETWQTVLFTTLAFAQVFQAIGTRSTTDSLLRIGLFSNPSIMGLVVLVSGLQMGSVYLPPMQKFLGTTALSGSDLLLSIAASSLVLVYSEVDKLLFPAPHARKAK